MKILQKFHGTGAVRGKRLLLLAALMVLGVSLLTALPRSLAQEATAQTDVPDQTVQKTSIEEFTGFYDPTKKQLTDEELVQTDPKAEQTAKVILPASTPQGTTEEIQLTISQIVRILSTLEPGLPASRAAVVLKGYSLVNQIGYFWGGKSLCVGWDDRWGNLATVVGDTESAGEVRPYGMDCSGYVSWTFLNASGCVGTAAEIGDGTQGQWARSVEIDWEEAQSGDLVFYETPTAKVNHVGILAGHDENGDWLVLNCAAGLNTVGLTALSQSGFRYVRRPLLYGQDGAESTFAQEVTANAQTAYGADILLAQSLSAYPAEQIAALAAQIDVE